MKIQVNGRFRKRRMTGVDRYAHELTTRLADMVEFVEPRSSVHGVRGHLWEQMSLPWKIRGPLLWSPCSTGPLAVRKQVVTIHDAAFVDQAATYTKAFAAWYQWLLPKLMRKVRRVLTVSEFSKTRLLDIYKLPEKQIEVIYCGVDRRFQPMPLEQIRETRARLGLPDRYVLCVGSLEPRKNLRRLLEAWPQVATKHPEVSLVLAGGCNTTAFADAGLPQNLERVKFTGYLTDADLPTVYSGAEVFIYPSIYEGFGLPVVEAMACGAPVITSNITSLPEVGADACEYVDPLDTDSIATAMNQLLSNPVRKDELRRLGFERAKRFTWEDSARLHRDVLMEAAQN